MISVECTVFLSLFFNLFLILLTLSLSISGSLQHKWGLRTTVSLCPGPKLSTHINRFSLSSSFPWPTFTVLSASAYLPPPPSSPSLGQPPQYTQLHYSPSLSHLLIVSLHPPASVYLPPFPCPIFPPFLPHPSLPPQQAQSFLNNVHKGGQLGGQSSQHGGEELQGGAHSLHHLGVCHCGSAADLKEGVNG